MLLRGFPVIFKQDERFDVKAAATYGELILKLLDPVSIDLGKIGWKMHFSDERQALTKLRELENKARVVVYSITDVAIQFSSLSGEDFYLKVKPPEGLIDLIMLVVRGKSMQVKRICFYKD